MARGPLAFKETDVARALRAASKAPGPFHVRIERRTGDILILPGDGGLAQGAPPPADAAEDDDLDRELAAWRQQREA